MQKKLNLWRSEDSKDTWTFCDWRIYSKMSVVDTYLTRTNKAFISFHKWNHHNKWEIIIEMVIDMLQFHSDLGVSKMWRKKFIEMKVPYRVDNNYFYIVYLYV